VELRNDFAEMGGNRNSTTVHVHESSLHTSLLLYDGCRLISGDAAYTVISSRSCQLL